MKTKANLFYYHITQNKIFENGSYEDTRLFDRALKEVRYWEQIKKDDIRGTKAFSIKGYMAILSFYDQGLSRQILIAPDDFKNDKSGSGRLKLIFEM